MISKKILVPVVLAVAIGGTAIFGVSLAQAQGRPNPFSGLVTAIAKKFNLDQAQVQAVVDDYQKTEQSTRQKDMQQRETDSLAKLVADGKITEAQKQLIIAEMTALKAKYNPENSKSLTDEQRKTQMQAERDELAAWAKANNIDEKYLWRR